MPKSSFLFLSSLHVLVLVWFCIFVLGCSQLDMFSFVYLSAYLCRYELCICVYLLNTLCLW